MALLAVARLGSFRFFSSLVEYLCVVARYYPLHTLRATVAQFDGVSVYYFLQLVFPWFILGEVLVNQLEELPAQVHSTSQIKWGIEPRDDSFSSSALGSRPFVF